MQMHRPPVRTITLGVQDAHPLTAAQITRAANVLEHARQRFSDAGYEVQTTRISTRPVFDDLAHWPAARLLDYARDLQQMLDGSHIGYCSLGPAQAARPDFPLARIELIPDLLAATGAINLTVQMAERAHGLREEAALLTARAMKRLAAETAEGFGNFNFAMLACVEPGTPFFPAAYHSGPGSLSLGLQGAGIVRDVADAWRATGQTEPPALARVGELVRDALVEQARPVVELGQTLAAEEHLQFGGIDLSPAPMGEESIGAAIEAFGYGPLGSPGTVALAAALTGALKSTALPTCGYCGLMLPVLEDAALGRRWAEGRVSIHELLLYSTICGTGLDTVPLPGDCEETTIARLLLDVATLAWRLNKPLSARLFPVPGKHAGERTAFSSPYLTNTLLRSRLLLRGQAAAPERVHHAIIGAFEILIEAGILNCQGCQAGQHREKLNILVVEGTRLRRVNAHHADRPAMHLQRHTEDRDNAFAPGLLFILKTRIDRYIRDNDSLPLQSRAIDRAVFDIDRPFCQVAAAQAVDRAQAQIAAVRVQQAQGAGFHLHGLGNADDNALQHCIELKA